MRKKDFSEVIGKGFWFNVFSEKTNNLGSIGSYNLDEAIEMLGKLDPNSKILVIDPEEDGEDACRGIISYDDVYSVDRWYELRNEGKYKSEVILKTSIFYDKYYTCSGYYFAAKEAGLFKDNSCEELALIDNRLVWYDCCRTEDGQYAENEMSNISFSRLKLISWIDYWMDHLKSELIENMEHSGVFRPY